MSLDDDPIDDPDEGAVGAEDEVFDASVDVEPGAPAVLPAPAQPRSLLTDLLPAACATLLTTGAVLYCFHPAQAGTPRMLIVMGATHLVLAVATLLWLRRRGDLRSMFKLTRGDVSIGGLVAAVMYMAGSMVHLAVTAPPSERSSWMLRLYLHIGAPEHRHAVAVGFGILAIAALEEIGWRGLAMTSLVERFGERRALVWSSLLYTLAHAPTLYYLSDPNAGPNPLVAAAALGGGLVWGTMALRFGRLPPAIFAHALFSWAIVQFPIFRP